MRSIHHLARRAAFALAIVALPAAAVHAVHAAAPGRNTAVNARDLTCAAAGTYLVGPPAPSPVQTLPPRSTGSRPPVGMASRPGIAWPAWDLRGTLTISSYTGCGTPTAGSFDVRRVILHPPVGTEKPIQPTMVPCAVYCSWPPTSIISATGSFAQDALHPSDPVYVTVSATVIVARPGPQLGIPCSVQRGCPPISVITSTVTFTDVTGYLQIAGTVATSQALNTGGGQMATLSFLPPPPANSNIPPTAVVLQGRRGQPAPSSVHPPSHRR